MIIEVDNNLDNNLDNKDKNTPTLEELNELFSDIAITSDFIGWKFERKLRKRNIL